MSNYLQERLGKGQSTFDAGANRLRQQKEDLQGVVTAQAGEKAQDLMSAVDKYTQPVSQAFSTIGHGKMAIQSIRKSNIVRRVLGQRENTSS